MIVKNKRTGKQFETTRDFFENSIVGKGNGDLYEVVEDEAPLEVKRLRDSVVELKSKNSKAVKA